MIATVNSMKSATIFASLFLLIGSNFAATPEYRSMGPDIFDPKTRAEDLIARAVTQASRENKRMLLLFGANWCPWCRRLHAALTEEPSVQAKLREKFLLVYVDANTRNDRNRNAGVLRKLGNPTLEHGLPVFVILDREGRHIGTRERASLAADTDAKVAARVLAFLNQWAK